MNKIRKYLEQVVDSLKLSANIRVHRKIKDQDFRQVVEEFKQLKRVKVNKQMKEEEVIVKSLRDTYEFKCFEHNRKSEVLGPIKKADFFMKFCTFPRYYMKEMWTKSRHFEREYELPKDFQWNKAKILTLLLFSVLLFKFGYRNGIKDSVLYDVVKENVIDIRTEDQLFDIITNRDTPVFVLYYIPGDYTIIDMMFAMGEYTEKYGSDNVIMAKVNCKYNLDLCIKKVQYLTLPQWEIMYPPMIETDQEGNDTKKIPVIPCKNNKSIEGIEAFMMEQRLIPDKYNPLYTLNNAMQKY